MILELSSWENLLYFAKDELANKKANKKLQKKNDGQTLLEHCWELIFGGS